MQETTDTTVWQPKYNSNNNLSYGFKYEIFMLQFKH